MRSFIVEKRRGKILVPCDTVKLFSDILCPILPITDLYEIIMEIRLQTW